MSRELKTYRVKKDVIFYHPTHIILLKGSTFKSFGWNSFILVRSDRIIITKLSEMMEYVEEI